MKDIRQEALRRRETQTAQTLLDRHLGEMRFIEIDLLNLLSVERAATYFKSREKKLDLLVLNAGIMAVPYSVTGDGFEVQLQINYISHFLLADRLVSMMEPPHTVKDPRIVFLSSIGHWLTPFRFKLSFRYNRTPNILFTWFRYGMAKTAGIQLMKSFAIQHPGVLCMAVHPGFVMNTNLFSHFTRLPIIGLMFWLFFQLFGWLFGVTNEEGSYSTLRCSLDKSLTPEKDNGKYFATFGIEQQPSRIAQERELADESWAWTVQELKKRGFEMEH